MFRVVAALALTLAVVTSVRAEEPHIGGSVLVLKPVYLGDNLKKGKIEAIPSEITDIRQVSIQYPSDAAPEIVPVKVIPVFERSAVKQTEHGKGEFIGRVYMLVPAKSEPITEKDLQNRGVDHLMYDQIETKMWMVNVVDAMFEGKLLHREIEAGVPGIAITRGTADYTTREGHREVNFR